MNFKSILLPTGAALLCAGLVTALVYISARDVLAQDQTLEKMRKVLTEGAGFTAEDLKSLEKGEIVVKELEPQDEREVAFSGAVRIEAPRDIVFEAFRRAIEKQEKEIATERGSFSSPPDLKDLSALTITSAEINNLRTCKVGECEWSFSEDEIGRLAEEIDWSSSGSREEATELVKKILVEYTADYLKGGDSALMVYRDDPEPLSLQDEHRSLLDGLLWIDDFAPEFKDYLRSFPSGKLDGVDGFVSWSNVRIGFKPVIVATHTIFYKKIVGDVPQAFIISKQIYANHYFHSSLALTAITSLPKKGGGFNTYVFFVNHSRAGALTGTMGQLARVAVDGEAENKLTGALADTKRFTAYALGGQKEAELAASSGFFGRIFSGYSYIWLIVIGVVAAAGIYFLTRKPKED